MSEAKKQRVAQAAIEYIEWDWIIGVGTGSTANCFIDELAKIKGNIDGAVASSIASAERLREKIVAAASDKFVCIADDSKLVDMLGAFPLPIEVIPMAQSYVGRELVKLGGQPVLRDGVTTDNGNIIIDVHNLEILNPVELEQKINSLAGVVTNGIFAERPADVVLLAGDSEVTTIS